MHFLCVFCRSVKLRPWRVQWARAANFISKRGATDKPKIIIGNDSLYLWFLDALTLTEYLRYTNCNGRILLSNTKNAYCITRICWVVDFYWPNYTDERRGCCYVGGLPLGLIRKCVFSSGFSSETIIRYFEASVANIIDFEIHVNLEITWNWIIFRRNICQCAPLSPDVIEQAFGVLIEPARWAAVWG